MAYTIATNSADINFSATFTGTTLVMGWFYPTTLTAGRGLWSYNNNAGLRIAAGGELQILIDKTTDASFTTVNANFSAVNQWYFIAAALGTAEESVGSGVWFATARVWIGTASTPPEPFGISIDTVTEGAGAPVTSSTFYIGNNGTSTNGGFQGVIGNMGILMNIPYSFILETEEVVYGFLHPFWQGQFWEKQFAPDTGSEGSYSPRPLLFRPKPSAGALIEYFFVDMANPVAPLIRRNNTNFTLLPSPIVANNNGCTFSQLAEPNRMSVYDAAFYGRRPRR